MSLLSKSIVAALSALVLATPALAQPFPEVIPLPTGFQPEGIAAGRGSTLFVGSIPTGAVFRGDLRTGDGDVIVPGREGRPSIGIKVTGRIGSSSPAATPAAPSSMTRPQAPRSPTTCSHPASQPS
jgi:hypothetical protein